MKLHQHGVKIGKLTMVTLTVVIQAGLSASSVIRPSWTWRQDSSGKGHRLVRRTGMILTICAPFKSIVPDAEAGGFPKSRGWRVWGIWKCTAVRNSRRDTP